jgi:phosphatidylglycerophosphatase A
VPFVARAFASGLFTGYVPVASGTVGALLGLLLYALPGLEHPGILFGVAFVVFILGVRTASLMERALGHDPHQVTIDEIVGMWVSLLFLPKSWSVALAAFFLFRLLDILKPFPARRFDRLSGGLGIMMDDVVAGAYTNLILQILIRAMKLA